MKTKRTRPGRRVNQRSKNPKDYAEIPLVTLAIQQASIPRHARQPRTIKSKWDEDVDCLEPVVDFSDLRLHIPLCPETSLAQSFVTALSSRHLQVDWCKFVPRHLGYYKEVVINAIQFQARKDVTIGRSAYRRYGQTLAALRTSLDISDRSLMAVGLMSLYDSVMGMHSKAQFTHRYGMGRILLLRRDPDGPNELARAILYADWDRRFRAPVGLGTPSPFDDSYWLQADPVHPSTIPTQIVSLRKLTNQLFIRLPRLVLYVRELTSKGVNEPKSLDEDIEKTVKLAEELLQLEDSEAENYMLHSITITKTKDEWDSPIIPYSFQYRSLLHMVAVSAYWQTRLMLMQLCLRLSGQTSATLSFSDTKLKSETLRMLTNVFMSWQYATEHSMLGKLCISQPLVVSFGACSTVDSWRDMPISSLRSWIVLRLKDSWGKWGKPFSSREIGEICDAFHGGPLKGFLVKVYADEKV